MCWVCCQLIHSKKLRHFKIKCAYQGDQIQINNPFEEEITDVKLLLCREVREYHKDKELTTLISKKPRVLVIAVPKDV